MRAVVGIALGIFTYVGAAFALAGDACDVAAHLVHADAELPRVSAAISKAKSLTVVVAGTTSSTLPGAAGPALAYPARFEAALQKKLPGVAVKVISLAKPRQTAADMAEAFPKVLKDEKPALVIWQTGTADAMRGVGAEAFQATLEGAVDKLQTGGADDGASKEGAQSLHGGSSARSLHSPPPKAKVMWRTVSRSQPSRSRRG